MKPLDLEMWAIQVPILFLEELVGITAVDDCLGLLKKGWTFCSTQLDECVGASIKAGEPNVASLLVSPGSCAPENHQSDREDDSWLRMWLVSKRGSRRVVRLGIRQSPTDDLDVEGDLNPPTLD